MCVCLFLQVDIWSMGITCIEMGKTFKASYIVYLHIPTTYCMYVYIPTAVLS